MSAFAERLAAGPVLLLDGGLGTQLMSRGLPPGQAPERWNVERPDDVAAVHAAYVAAGSEAVQTNTFGGNRMRLARYGLAGHLGALNTAAVRLARSAGARFVIGNVGPSGEYLPPMGCADPAQWRRVFAEQGAVLAEAGVDGFHVETMSDLREALVALEALHAVAPELPVMVSLTFDRRPRGHCTMAGDRPAAAWGALHAAGASAVGANCTLTSAEMAGLAEAGIASGWRPVLQPNAGQPEVSGAAVRYTQSPAAFGEDMVPFASQAAALGGCCGTAPSFIAELARRLGR